MANNIYDIYELLDMYESVMSLVSGAIIRMDISNGRIIFSNNLKNITGLGNDELPNNVNELKALLVEEDFEKLLNIIHNVEYNTEWNIKVKLKKEREGYDVFDLIGKKEKRGLKDFVYFVIRNPNQNFGMFSPDLLFPKDFFDNSLQAIIITNSQNEVVRVNKHFVDMTGYSMEEVLGKNPSFWSSQMHDKEFYEKMWRDLKTKGFWSGIIWDKKKNGEVLALRSNIFEIRGANNQLVGYIAINSDVTDRIQKENELIKKVKYDSVTSLPNKNHLLEYINKISSEKLTKNNFSLLLIKICEYHELFDAYGIEKANFVIKRIADKIIKLLEKEFYLARYSDEEFSIFGEFENIDQIQNLADSLIKILSEPILVLGEKIYVKVSIGISIYPKDCQSLEDIINKARIALSRSLEGNYSFYSKEISNHIKSEKTLEVQLYEALKDNHFFLQYQPQFSYESKTIIGAEALIRLKNIDGSVNLPLSFLRVAEKKRLLDKIDEYVLKKVIKAIKEINRENSKKEVRIFSNVSKDFFDREDFVNIIYKILLDNDVDPKYLGIELTENIFIRDFYSAQKKIKSLKEMGVKIALDDFGTGYSSLSYLSKLDIDKIKIDKSFMDNLFQSSQSKKLVSTIIYLAKSLDMEVIAEGVESSEQLEFLKEKECYEIQGYYFSPPVSLSEFKKLLYNHSKI